MLYTKAAALRILKIATKVESVKVLKNCVQVTYKTAHGRCSTFLSKTVFKQNFVSDRKAAATALICSEVMQGCWKVGNPQNGNVYDVWLSVRSVDCGCEDYRQQIDTIGKGICKHGYRVLTELGIDSLAEYIQSNRPAA